MNDQILPKGVKDMPFLDRSDLIHLTTHTVMHNLTEGIILVIIILMLFFGNVRGASSSRSPSRSRCCLPRSVSA